MVVFTCNHCGESLKKGHVDKHAFRCSRQSEKNSRGVVASIELFLLLVSVSCMDCFKDFDQESYSQHTQCVTELQRYSGKDYVEKANANKGQKKQEAWVGRFDLHLAVSS
jgi:cell growth-regulating nucleolar protein